MNYFLLGKTAVYFGPFRLLQLGGLFSPALAFLTPEGQLGGNLPHLIIIHSSVARDCSIPLIVASVSLCDRNRVKRALSVLYTSIPNYPAPIAAEVPKLLLLHPVGAGDPLEEGATCPTMDFSLTVSYFAASCRSAQVRGWDKIWGWKLLPGPTSSLAHLSLPPSSSFCPPAPNRVTVGLC